MQRIISMQVIRDNERGPSEFVTKRLCCSFLFSVAFLSLLGGFLLGRYSTDRAILLKNALLQQQQQAQEKFSMEILNNITTSLRLINNMTKSIEKSNKPFDYKLYYHHLSCVNHTANISIFEGELDRQTMVKTSKILTLQLDSVSECFYSIRNYLDTYLYANVTVTSDGQ